MLSLTDENFVSWSKNDCLKYFFGIMMKIFCLARPMFQHVKAARKVARPAMKSRLLEVSLARLSTVADSSTITTTVMPYRVCREKISVRILILYTTLLH